MIATMTLRLSTAKLGARSGWGLRLIGMRLARSCSAAHKGSAHARCIWGLSLGNSKSIFRA
jgi:hypothetical protein